MTKKFNLRAFISLYIVISFLIAGISGVILFLSPPGRIANWTNLTILGLAKSQWQALHTVFTFLFVLAAAVHIYFNWRPLTAYLRTKAQHTRYIRKELISSGLLVIILSSLTLTDIPPFSTLMQLSEDLSYSWSTPGTEPPIPHAELLTIEELGVRTGIPVPQIISNLSKAGIRVETTTTTLGQIAASLDTAPQELYKKIMTEKNKETYPGGGYGRMTLRTISEQLSIPLEQCLNHLKQNGIETDPDVTLRDLADRLGMNPHDILSIIRDS